MDGVSEANMFSDLPESYEPPIDMAMLGRCRICHAVTNGGANLCEKAGCADIVHQGEALEMLAKNDDVCANCDAPSNLTLDLAGESYTTCGSEECNRLIRKVDARLLTFGGVPS